MYITNLTALPAIISERFSQRLEIRRKVEAWIEQRYGIKNFFSLTHSFLNVDPDRTCFVLCRQIPSVRTEDIVCRLAGEILGYEVMSLAFIEDNFSCQNHEKKSYIDLRWSEMGRKRIPFLRGERLVDAPMMTYEGQMLSSIRTNARVPGETICDFHFGLRSRLFGESDRLCDVSELHRCYVRAAEPKPPSLYRATEGRMRLAETNGCDLAGKDFRPPSEWYYPLFFSWFLDGTMVMLETYDNELAQVSQAKNLFERTVKEIEYAVGLAPLVVKIPPLDERMLALPKWVIETPGSLAYLRSQFEGHSKEDSVIFFNKIAETVLAGQP